MKKKLYDVQEGGDDIVLETLAATQDKIYDILQKYKENVIPGDENKYDFLLEKLQPFMTPFIEPTMVDDIVEEKIVQGGWTAVVDNLGDFYATAFGPEEKKYGKKKSFVYNLRFLTNRYVRGFSKLVMVKETVQKSSIQKKIVTENDTIFIQSLLFLPYAFIEYAKMNLPNTSLLAKIRLEHNSVPYFQIFNNQTDIIQKEQNNVRLLHSIVQTTTQEDIPSDGDFLTYLDRNIPTSLEIFKLLEPKIKFGVSFPRLLEYLQPFLIYLEDLTMLTYEKMVSHIDKTILTIKKELGKNFRNLLSITAQFLTMMSLI